MKVVSAICSETVGGTADFVAEGRLLWAASVTIGSKFKPKSQMQMSQIIGGPTTIYANSARTCYCNGSGNTS